MRVLLIGGSGTVGTMVSPYLAEDHQLRVFDLKPPLDESIEFFSGDLTRFEDLEKAVAGMDAIVYMAMGSLAWDTINGVNTAFDINIKCLFLALKAAHEAGITQAVYTSSMSVYADLDGRKFAEESMPTDASDLYGFTKRLGEDVCQNAVANWGMHVNALRLCFPTMDETFAEVEPNKRLIATAASDVANAIHSALLFHGRFQAFMISGDHENQMMNMSKAKSLLGWEPLARA